MGFMTFLKTGAYFLSSASIIPVRTGVVRDIRNQLYPKDNIAFAWLFQRREKGRYYCKNERRCAGGGHFRNVFARFAVQKSNPRIDLLHYFDGYFVATDDIHPAFRSSLCLVYGHCGQKIKAKQHYGTSLWSDTMSQVEETLGGLRIIKAFCAEGMMNQRFIK